MQPVEPCGATFLWLRLLCVSRNRLQVQLLGWSCSICTRLARLLLELVLEPLQEPGQTGPISEHFGELSHPNFCFSSSFAFFSIPGDISSEI